jgi:HSP20 family protein
MWDIKRQSLVPLTSIWETDDNVIIEIDLPLVKKRDIHLRLVEEGLEIEASLKRCVQFKSWGTIQRSCEFRSFYKIISLPTQVVPEGAKATFKKGILRIELKKRKKGIYQISID